MTQRRGSSARLRARTKGPSAGRASVGRDAAPSNLATPVRVVTLGALRVDRDGYRAEFAGRRLPLSRSQLELLAILVANVDRVLSRTELAQALGLAGGRSVDVLLSGLRQAIGRDFVRNVRNRGWIVEPPSLAI